MSRSGGFAGLGVAGEAPSFHFSYFKCFYVFYLLRLLEDECHADLSLHVAGTTLRVHTAIIKQRYVPISLTWTLVGAYILRIQEDINYI